MAVRLMESFDPYQASKAVDFGWSGAPTSLGTGRFGTGQYNRETGAAITKTIPGSALTTLWFGFALRVSALNTSCIEFRSGASGGNIITVSVNSSGRISVTSTGGASLTGAITTLITNAWYYIEAKVVINGASGTARVFIDGAEEIATTTANFGSTGVDTVRLDAAGAISVDTDDLYVLDSTGTNNNDFLGPQRIDVEVPTAEGATIQFTPSTGTDNSALVDEMSGTFPNGDTDYNSDGTVGHLDTFTMGGVPSGSPTVSAVKVSLYARKDDAGPRTIAPVVRQGGTNYVGSDLVLGASYRGLNQIYDLDPLGSAWTGSTIGDEFGYKLTA